MLPELSDGQKKLVAGGAAALVFVLMAFAVANTEAWQSAGAGFTEDFDALAVALFTDHVIALEVLGVLLTAAMIGAMVIARPMEEGEDVDHYTVVSDETLEATQLLSNAGASFAAISLEEEE